MRRGAEPADWIVIRNRLAPLTSRNSRNMDVALADISRNLGIRLVPGISERIILGGALITIALVWVSAQTLTLSAEEGPPAGPAAAAAWDVKCVCSLVDSSSASAYLR